MFVVFFFFQAEDGIRDAQESRGLGDVYKRQAKELARADKIQQLLTRIQTPEFQQKQADLLRAEAQKKVPTEDAEALAAFDRDMLADEARRAAQMDKLLRGKYGGIHPLYGSKSAVPPYDAARSLPLHAYPYKRPSTSEGVAYQQQDLPYVIESLEDGRSSDGVPQAVADQVHRYSHPLAALSDDDLDRIDRHRLAALKAQLEQNGFTLPGNALYPGTKYPLTGPPLKLQPGDPLVAQDSKPQLLSAAPEIRAGQLLQDDHWLTQREEEMERQRKDQQEVSEMHRLMNAYGATTPPDRDGSTSLHDPPSPSTCTPVSYTHLTLPTKRIV
eukprot:TRINITY_DN27681_c0_g1_i1.p1 TRINITY_DN27681_c0_g1~~TRINITY_DN27681_c0_g1_i1.p1  ORF type:complete len:329 (+),score=94.63 TRINITY_DN27681_c0_g1_i1:44-1030(+)